MDNIMENPRFHSQKKSNTLAEHSMFTTLQVDDETKIDIFIKLKKFNSTSDGQFSLVVLSEVDTASRMITGRYIIIKLNECKDWEREQNIQEAEDNQRKKHFI